MSSWLRQSTSATVKIGPFLDEDDGKTAETGLTIAQADVRLSKNGGDIAQKTEATSCTHDELGIYGCPIDTTDTATLGRLQLWVHESGALPVWHEFMVVPANVWDSMFGSDKLEVDATLVEGSDATDQINAACDTAVADYDGPTNAEMEARTLAAAAYFDPAADAVADVTTVATLTGHTAQTGDNYARLGAPAGASIAADLVAIDNFVDDLESRLTATRAGYLDELAAANLPTDIADVPTVAEMTAAFTEIKGAGWSGATDTLEEIADSIAAAAPLPYHPDASSTVVTGTETNTYADAASDNAVRWSSADTGTGIEMIAEMNLGAGRVATALTVNGYFDAGASRIVEIWHYDYVSAAYVKLSDGTAAKEMRNSASDNDYTFSLPQSATDRATVPGEVKIKLLAAQTNATDELFLDLVEVAGVASGATSPEAIADAIATSDWGESINHIPRFTGEVLYVAGSTGNDTNSGIYPDSGLATIAAAVTTASAGDYLEVFADSFTEAVNLSKNGLELHGEIGAIITGASGVPLTISADYCRVDEIILTPAAGQLGLVITGDYNKIRILRITGGLTAVQDTGTGNEITLVTADEYTATGFDLQGPSGYVCDCLARSSQASTRGFYLSNTAADRTVVRRSTSVNNDTAGFEIVAGVVNAAIVNCSESPTCGARVDNGTNTSWRNHSRTDHQTDISSVLADTNELQTDDVPGLVAALNDPTAVAIRTEIDSNSTQLAAIVADTNELQTDDYPTFIAAIKAETVLIVADTNELQTDDIPGAISGLNDPTVAAIRTEMDNNSTQLAAIVADTNELQTDDVPGLIGALNDLSAANVNTEVDTALADIHLDHLLAADYDPASKPGAATALLNELVESDAGVSRLTENALEQAPSGTGASAATIADAVWDEAAADHVAGGSFGVQAGTDIDTILADTNELQTDDVPGLISGLNDPTAAAVADAVWDEDIVVAHNTADTAGVLLDTDLATILADTNELQTDDVPGLIGALNDPTAAAVRTEIDSNSTQLATIVADTNELQIDDVPGLITALNDISVTDITQRQIPDSVPADGTRPTVEQALYMITQFLYERAVSGTTVTVKKVDGSTSLLTLMLDDGTDPTSITRAT